MSEERHRHDHFLAAYGRLIQEHAEEGTVNLATLPDSDLLERFYNVGWAMGRAYEAYVQLNGKEPDYIAALGDQEQEGREG